MNKGLNVIDINWRILGEQLAKMSTEEQVPFFQGFTNEMNKYPSEYQRGMQLSYIANNLSKEQMEVLKYIGDNDE